jgi:hypothetical protein
MYICFQFFSTCISKRFLLFQVVYNQEIPNLHGILKQRSVSESSEDLISSTSSCSPSSPRDELFGFKKSVKFNDRIDHTTFRTGAAVTSMTTALKSKRRRNRKRDEKKSGRQRVNSGGSGQYQCTCNVLWLVWHLKIAVVFKLGPLSLIRPI